MTTPWRSSSWRARACDALGGGRRRLPESRDERPPAGAGRRSRPPERARSRRVPGPRRADLRGGASDERSQRREGVVGDLAGPDEIPQRGEEEALVRRAGGGDELGPERRAPLGEMEAERVVHLALRRVGGRLGEQRGGIGAEDERDAAVVGGERPRADPGHVAARHEGVEVCGTIRPDPGREDVRLQDRGRHGGALEPGHGVRERVDVTPGSVRALPHGEEAGERRRVDGFHLATEQGERSAAEPAEHVGFAPFAPRAAGPELAQDDVLRSLPETRARRARVRPKRRAERPPPRRGTVRASWRIAGRDPPGAGRSGR